MRYDVRIAAADDALDGWVWSCSAGLHPVLAAAGADLDGLSGRVAGRCLPTVAAAVAEVLVNQRRYRAADPPGGYDALVDALTALALGLGADPAATVWVYQVSGRPPRVGSEVVRESVRAAPGFRHGPDRARSEDNSGRPMPARITSRFPPGGGSGPHTNAGPIWRPYP